MPRGKRDANERQIIQALEAAGCGVLQLEDPDNAGVPDLLVTKPANILFDAETFLIEVKMPGHDAEPHQKRWHANWPGKVVVAHTAQEALAAADVHAEHIPRESRNIAQTGGGRKKTAPAWPLKGA